MNVKDKQRIVIKFLLSEEYAGEEIVICLQSVYDSAPYCHTSVFSNQMDQRSWPRQQRTPKRKPSGDPIDTKPMRRFGQFCKKTRMSR
jgi:hypothetical protein